MEYIPVYRSYLERMEDLSDAQFGALIRAGLRYAFEDQTEPEGDFAVRLLFKSLRFDIDRSRDHYEGLRELRREAGKKGAAARWSTEERKRKTEEPEQPAGKPDPDQSDPSPEVPAPPAAAGIARHPTPVPPCDTHHPAGIARHPQPPVVPAEPMANAAFAMPNVANDGKRGYDKDKDEDKDNDNDNSLSVPARAKKGPGAEDRTEALRENKNIYFSASPGNHKPEADGLEAAPRRDGSCPRRGTIHPSADRRIPAGASAAKGGGDCPAGNGGIVPAVEAGHDPSLRRGTSDNCVPEPLYSRSPQPAYGRRSNASNRKPRDAYPGYQRHGDPLRPEMQEAVLKMLRKREADTG